MQNPDGYFFSFDVTGIRQEADTFTCNHCNKIVIVKPKCDPYDLGGMCKLCDKMICPDCVNLNQCTPFEKKLETAERQQERARWYARMKM